MKSVRGIVQKPEIYNQSEKNGRQKEEEKKHINPLSTMICLRIRMGFAMTFVS